VTWFLYDGINILQDLDENGNPVASYNQGIGIDKLISRKTGQGRVYYHSDAIGSVRSLTDGDQKVVGECSYDAWGKLKEEWGKTGNEYKFTSRRWEQELGLQYNRARFYDPEVGRFTTPDPLTGGPDDPSICYLDNIYAVFHRFIREHVDSLEPNKHNRYVYCYNNPVNRIDPLGLQG
jgi:RHS repeat-associated protein